MRGATLLEQLIVMVLILVVLSIPVLLLTVLVVVLAVGWFMTSRRHGRDLYAVGSNPPETLTGAYLHYIQHAHPIHDAPTVAMLHEIVSVKEQQRLWLRDYRRRYENKQDQQPPSRRPPPRQRASLAPRLSHCFYGNTASSGGRSAKVMEAPTLITATPSTPWARPPARSTRRLLPAARHFSAS